MKETVMIDGRAVTFKASAAIPRLYRLKFRRDIMEDMRAIERAVKSAQDGESAIPPLVLEMFENVAFLMARHATPDMPETTVEEWLDGFQMLSIYEIFPVIQRLWGVNNQSIAHPAKK